MAVEANGVTVELARGEGVEVATGSAPGEKFQALDREIDFSAWDGQKLTQMLSDPVQAALNIEKRMNEYIRELKNIYPLWFESKAKLDAEREALSDLHKSDPQNNKAVNKYYNMKVLPLEMECTYLYMNIRFYALSALSLKRFVLGRLYLNVKLAYITEPTHESFSSFLNIYNRLLAQFEENVARIFLVKADI